MNIKAQCCGLALLAVVYLFYMRKKTLHLDTERAFLRAFWMTVLCLVMDILSVIVSVNYESLPVLLTGIVCKTYLVTLVGVCLCSMLYICSDLFKRKEQYRKKTVPHVGYVLGIAALICVLPVQVYCDGEGGVVYKYGPGVLVTYLGAVSLILGNLLLLYRYREKINPRRGRAVTLWMGLWLVSALIQFLDARILVVGFASAIGMVALYLQFENPELNMDWMSGLFNQSAFMQYCSQLYSKEIPFVAVAVFLDPDSGHELKEDNLEKATLDKFSCFLTVPDSLAFRMAEDEVLLLFENEQTAEAGIRFLQEHTEWSYVVDAGSIRCSQLLYIPDTHLAKNGRELLEIIEYAERRNRKHLQSSFVQIDAELAEEMRRERRMEQQILDAIEQDRIVVYYQPIYSTEEQQFTSAEALVRILDENGKILPPADFIQIAEENGTILEIGRIVFEKVCRFFKENHLEQYGIHYIEVNLSVVQCAYEQLAVEFISIMEKYELSPCYINLEITESASIQAKKTLLDNMKCLLNYGVQFSLDDFGTGQSNLNYIVDMPVSIVKFDRHMTYSYFENGKARYVMDAAMHMIHGMELEIVSEGIETEKQFRIMEGLGINYIQGYYFSRPLPEQDFIELIAQKAAKM